MGIGDTSVKRISNLVGLTSLGRKAEGSGVGVTLSTEDLAKLEAMRALLAAPPLATGASTEATLAAQAAYLARLAPATPIRRRGAVLGSTWSAFAIWPGTAATVVHLKDIVFSTDAALNLKLHQATMATYAAQLVTDSALWHWQMDETSGNIASSIGTKNLTAVGAPTYSAASLVTADGTSIELNGSSSGFTGAVPPASAAAGAIEAWVWLDTYPASAANRYFQLSDGASTSNALGVGINHGGTYAQGLPTLVMRSGAGSLVWNAFGPHPIPLRTWAHIVWSHDGTGLVLYVNGKQETVQYETGSDANAQWYDDISAGVTTLTLGYFDGATNDNWFDGRLSNVAWYATAMSAAVAANHYKLGAPLWGPHYFAATTGTASPLGYEIVLESGASIYAGTSASANATLELLGYEV